MWYGHGRTGRIGSYAYDCITRSHDNCMMTMSSLNDFHYSHPWLGPFPGFQCCMPPTFQHVPSKPGNGPEVEVRALATCMLKSIATMVSVTLSYKH